MSRKIFHPLKPAEAPAEGTAEADNAATPSEAAQPATASLSDQPQEQVGEFSLTGDALESYAHSASGSSAGDLTDAEFKDWGAWKKKVFGKIPLSYRAGGLFIMAAGTFEGYIDGMQDANGQPVARVNYGITQGAQERFGGKEVLLVEEDVVVSYDAAAVGDVVAVFMNPSDYCINSNMQMSMYRWLDHDTNQWVDKAILINDGKLLDAAGVLLIKKGA